MKDAHLAFDLSAWLFSGKIRFATLSNVKHQKNGVSFILLHFLKQFVHQKLLKRFLQVLSWILQDIQFFICFHQKN